MINRSPWLWGARKTAAGMTGRTSLGLMILQGKRAKGQSNPSPEFIQAQSVARQLNDIWHKVAAVIKRGFTGMGPGQSQYSLFIKYGYNLAFDLSLPPVADFVPEELEVTRGNMTPTAYSISPVATASNQHIVMTWPAAPIDGSQLGTDIMQFVVYNSNGDKWVPGEDAAVRSDGTATFTMPPATFISGQVMHIYLGFRGADLTATAGTTSTSTNVQITAIA